MHLVDSIYGRCVHLIHFVCYPVFRIKKIGHLHALLQIVLRQLQNYIRFLRNRTTLHIRNAYAVILFVRVLRIINKLSQFNPILLK